MRGVRRRLDADPVLRLVLPRARQDVPPRGHPRRQPARRPGSRSRPASPPPSTGRTGCRRVDHAEAAVDALQAVPGRFVLAYGNIQAGPWEWTADPAVRAFLERRRTGAGDMLGFQLAFDVTGDPAFPEKAAFEVARELGLPVTTHAGVWGATNDDGIRLMHENGFVTPGEHLRARGHAEHRLLPADRGHRRLGLGVDRVRAERRPGLPAHLAGAPATTSRCRCRWTPACGGAATCSRRCGRRSAPTARASTSRRTPRATPSPTLHLRAEHVVDWATRGGARALGRDDLGRLEPGRQGRRRADQERPLAGVVPAAQPLRPRRVPGPARRRAHRARRRPGREAARASWSASTWPPYAATSRRPSSTCGRAWARRPGTPGMNPELPEGGKVLDNPYQYTEYQSDARTAPAGTIFGEPGLGEALPRTDGDAWQDVARDRTSSRRWRAGSTCCACFDARPPRDDAERGRDRRPAWPGRPPGGCC